MNKRHHEDRLCEHSIELLVAIYRLEPRYLELEGLHEVIVRCVKYRCDTWFNLEEKAANLAQRHLIGCEKLLELFRLKLDIRWLQIHEHLRKESQSEVTEWWISVYFLYLRAINVITPYINDKVNHHINWLR